MEKGAKTLKTGSVTWCDIQISTGKKNNFLSLEKEVLIHQDMQEQCYGFFRLLKEYVK